MRLKRIKACIKTAKRTRSHHCGVCHSETGLRVTRTRRRMARNSPIRPILLILRGTQDPGATGETDVGVGPSERENTEPTNPRFPWVVRSARLKHTRLTAPHDPWVGKSLSDPGPEQESILAPHGVRHCAGRTRVFLTHRNMEVRLIGLPCIRGTGDAWRPRLSGPCILNRY